MTRCCLITMALALALVVVACGDEGGEDDRQAAPAGPPVEVSALDNLFRPESITVQAGTEVVWDNDGRSDHDIIPADGDGWGVDLEDFHPGDTYRHTFTEPGTYRYYCSIHGTADVGMIGVVEVTE